MSDGHSDLLSAAKADMPGGTQAALPLFEKLKKGGPYGAPVLINAGRGGQQIEDDIVKALDRGLLSAASLDVFNGEPLPPEVGAARA